MNPTAVYQWIETISNEWEGVSPHFRKNVQHFSAAVVRAGSSQIRKIAGMAAVPGQSKADSQRRRLQRFVKQDHALDPFFSNWSRSVVQTLDPDEVVLIVDETKLKAVFGVMVVGMVYQRRCIPLAWRVYRANCSDAYPDEGQVELILKLLQAIQSGLPAGRPVRVLADRGIGTSPELMRGIVRLGWTFLFRVTKQSKIVLADGTAVPFYDQVTAPGEQYNASGIVFKNRGHIPAHVRVVWQVGGREPWALVTNDPNLTGWEYARRMWIEEAFRDLKSHGWQLEATTFTDPDRMARLWIVLVLAYAWMLLLGQALVERGAGAALKRCKGGSRVQRWSLFRQGRQAFLTTPLPFVT